MKNLRGIYPGTFDPFTKGHSDIAERAAKWVDELILAVSDNQPKKTFFTLEERVALVKASIRDMPAPRAEKMTIVPFQGLLVDFVKAQDADIVFRGLRATTDFEYEFQMASLNRKLDDHVDTLFLTASDKYHFISSSMMREVSGLGGDVTNYVSAAVAEALKQKAKG